MLPHTDIPTRAQLDQLLANRHPMSVSIYVPTDPVSANVGERIEMSNLASEALDQLRAAQGAKRELRALEEELGDLIDDETFWRFQARSLATFATPDHLVTFRLPNRLVSLVETSDRFHLKPLLRAATFPQTALVLVDVARAATHGAIDTVMVDIDEVVPGSIDEQSGQVTLAQGPSAAAYGVVDEIARRVWLAGGRVLALRRDDIPGQGSVAAILRYAL